MQADSDSNGATPPGLGSPLASPLPAYPATATSPPALPLSPASPMQPCSQPSLPSTHLPSGHPAVLRVLEERLAPSEQPAARAVLHHMYTEQLVFDSPAQLVTVLKIADKWQVQDTVDACRTAFSQLRAQDIDLEVIKKVYGLEGVVHNHAHFKELLATVQARLVALFKDVVEVITSPALQAHFLQLPFAAMLALLRSEQLEVDSENSVVVAATLWMTRGRGRFTSPEQRRFLAGAVRLSALSPSFLCGVLPNLKWFTWPQACPGPYYAALQARMVGPEASAVLTAHGQTSMAVCPAPAPPPLSLGLAGQQQGGGTPLGHSLGSLGPAAALAPAGRVAKEQNLELVCDVDAARLTQYLADGLAGLRASPDGFKGVHVQSESSYFRGHQWGIKLVFGYSAGPAAALPAVALMAGQGSGSTATTPLSSATLAHLDSINKTAPSTPGPPATRSPLFSRNSKQPPTPSAAAQAAAAPSTPGSAASSVVGDAYPSFSVTPSVFASLAPGEEGLLPLITPITVSFKCTLEAIGSYNSAYASATFAGASFMKPGDEAVSSIGISNFFKKIANPASIDCWRPYLNDGKLRLKLCVTGASVE
ncbi:hypothetical protein V8C86DRAFT_1452386 [Haematococcus lacustris]